MRQAEQGCEGNDQDHVAEIVADVQNPASSIFPAGRGDERPDNQFSIVTRFSQVGDNCLGLIDEDALFGIVEVDLGPPRLQQVWPAVMLNRINLRGKFRSAP